MSCVEKDTLDNLEILTEGIITADKWTFDTAKLSVYGCGGGVVSYTNPFYWEIWFLSVGNETGLSSLFSMSKRKWFTSSLFMIATRGTGDLAQW